MMCVVAFETHKCVIVVVFLPLSLILNGPLSCKNELFGISD